MARHGQRLFKEVAVFPNTTRTTLILVAPASQDASDDSINFLLRQASDRGVSIPSSTVDGGYLWNDIP